MDCASFAGEAYFKLSWPEDDRSKEAKIIKAAQIRVRQFFPVAIQQCVLDHLPRVHDESVVLETCTAIIRALLGPSTKDLGRNT